MSQHTFQARPEAVLRRDGRNEATLVLAQPQEGSSLRYRHVANPYDRFVDEYEMPDGEIVQRGDAPQMERSSRRAGR
jgi:hypothetical protein